MPCEWTTRDRGKFILLHRVDAHMLNRAAKLSNVQIMHKIRFESMTNTAGCQGRGPPPPPPSPPPPPPGVVPVGVRNEETTMGMSTNNSGAKARHIRTRMNCIFSPTVIGSFPLLSVRCIILWVLALERGATVARSEPGGRGGIGAGGRTGAFTTKRARRSEKALVLWDKALLAEYSVVCVQ